MIELYYWPTPNGHKVTMFLEEAGLDYMIQSVDISAGDQFRPDFLAISPDNRMSAIVDTARRRTDRRVRVRCHPVVPGREDRSLPAEGRTRPQGRDGVAVLASWRAGADGRTEPPFRALRSQQNLLRDRPLRQGDEPSLRRARSTSRWAHVHRGCNVADIASNPWIVPWKRQQQTPDDFLNLRRWFEMVRQRASVLGCSVPCQGRAVLEPPSRYGRRKEDPVRTNVGHVVSHSRGEL
jgi:GST-like protein